MTVPADATERDREDGRAREDGREGGVLDRRDRRALREEMVVVEDAPDLYHVYGEDGTRYVVDSREGACTCPDFQYRAVECKHIRRARLETGEYDAGALAADVEEAIDAVDAEIERLAARRADLVTLRNAVERFE